MHPHDRSTRSRGTAVVDVHAIFHLIKDYSELQLSNCVVSYFAVRTATYVRTLRKRGHAYLIPGTDSRGNRVGADGSFLVRDTGSMRGPTHKLPQQGQDERAYHWFAG